MTSEPFINIRWWKVTRLRNLNGSSAQNPSPLGWLTAQNFHTSNHPPRRTNWFQEKAGMAGMITDQPGGKRPERHPVQELSVYKRTHGGIGHPGEVANGLSYKEHPNRWTQACLGQQHPTSAMGRKASIRSISKAVVKPAMRPRTHNCQDRKYIWNTELVSKLCLQEASWVKILIPQPDTYCPCRFQKGNHRAIPRPRTPSLAELLTPSPSSSVELGRHGPSSSIKA